MAETVQITARGKRAKIRNPWGVLGLTLVTLGIYYLFWYFFVNREMSDWGEQHQTDIGLSPGTSLLAITIGGFVIIPPYVSIFHTGKRMQLAQRVGGVHGGSGLTFFFLSIIPIANFFAPVYLQSELNKVWERELHEQTGGTPELMTAVEPVFSDHAPVLDADTAAPAPVAMTPPPATPDAGSSEPEGLAPA